VSLAVIIIHVNDVMYVTHWRNLYRKLAASRTKQLYFVQVPDTCTLQHPNTPGEVIQRSPC